jgi:sarcosine oxidase gamma subunit
MHMPKIHTWRVGRRAHARLGSSGGRVSCVVASVLAVAAGTAQAAVPKVGAWESGSRSDPRVSFDVQGPARARTVRRVSFPIACKGDRFPVGWGATTIVDARGKGRFAAYDGDSVVRAHFIAKDRAEVTVHSDDGSCKGTRRYRVVARGRRLGVRSGQYLSLVTGGGATVGMEVDAFGRMVTVSFINGTVPSRCSDGSQRPLTLAGPDEYILAAPIRPNGRFDVSASAAGSRIAIGGTFSGGSVAALVDLSVVLPDGSRCTAPTQSLVGSLAFPLPSLSGEELNSPGPPVIVQPPT